MALVLSHSYILINIAFIFITAAFKKGIDEFVCKPELFNFSTMFLFFFLFLIPFFSLFLCIPPKCCCITRILMNYLIGKKEVGKKWLNFCQVSNIFYQPKFSTDFFLLTNQFLLISFFGWLRFFPDISYSFLSALRSKMPKYIYRSKKQK